MIGVVAQTDPALEALLDAFVRILGFCILAAGTAAAAAFVFRWYSADELAEGVGILVGITTVAIWLNTKTALQDAIIGTSRLLETETAVYTVIAFVASAIAADAGRRLGDHLARDAFALAAPRTIDDVGELVRSAGRVIAVELPETIEDVDGYDPVDAGIKADLAGETLLFPRRLTAGQLRERLIARLERDYGIGHVDVELATDGEIEYLALGSRPAGIGPTLAPGTVAVAIRADPAADASPGDAVRIWTRNGDGDAFRCAAGGELRGTADDVATVAIDADEVRALEADAAHRLVTLPGTPDAERELVSALRAADETVTALTVAAGGSLEGATIDSLPTLVLAVDREDDAVALPSGETRLVAGDVAYVLGRPDALRRIPER
ncbi:TrkA C-terminal domain-containing protein [Natronococcus wangiae]|uniref:TrkA C-terminal domain-containing protein n=1 Tax=Natronococcus wangiae TaxID=3068275 RepID=UPI00273F0AA3|nr:TrkA C-terminal domain-containing protein [Natronococcus sp. AD5]